jgi:hypothetical protein
MSEVEDLKARIDALESWSLKHLSHLYAVVEPAKLGEGIDSMTSIYRHPTSAKVAPKSAVESADTKAEGFSTIYRHPMSGKQKQ